MISVNFSVGKKNNTAASEQPREIPLHKIITLAKDIEILENEMNTNPDFPLDIPRQLTAEEKTSSGFAVRCKVARGCILTLLEADVFTIHKTQKHETLRSVFLRFNAEGPDILKDLMNTSSKDHKLMKERLSKMGIVNCVWVENGYGKKASSAFKVLVDMPDFWDLSFVTIFGHEAEKDCGKALAKLSFTRPNMTIQEAFTQEFFRWMLGLAIPEMYTDHLLDFWGKFVGKHIVQKKDWVEVITAVAPFAEIKTGLSEFQSMYESLQAHGLCACTLADLSLIHYERPPVPLNATQLLNGYREWNRALKAHIQNQNQFAKNIINGAETVADHSYEQTKKLRKRHKRGVHLIVDQAVHKKFVKNGVCTQDEKNYIRLSKYMDKIHSQKFHWVEEEIGLLQKVSQSARLVELTLLFSLEQMLKVLDETAVCTNAVTHHCTVQLEGGVFIQGGIVDGKIGEGKKSTIVQPSKLDPNIKVATQAAKNDLVKQQLRIVLLQAYSRELIDLIRQNLVPAAPPASSDSKEPAIARTTSTNAATAVRPPSPKLLTREAFRRRLAYETLALTDLIDIDEIAPPTAPKAPPLKKSSPPKTALIPKAESATALPHVALPPPVATEVSTKELDLQLGVLERSVAEISKATISSTLIGSASPFVLALTQALYPAGRTAEAQEAADHLFLATQSLEVIAECLVRKKPDLLASAYRAFLLDAAITLEQTLKLKHPSAEHNLVKLAESSGLQLTSAQHAFLHEFQQATLWARYPAASTAFFGNDALPTPLRTLSQLSNTVPNTFVLELFAAYRQVLSIAVSPELMKTKSAEKFVSLLAQLEKALVVPSAKVSLKKTAQQTAIEQALAHTHYAQMQDEDPTLPLQEISHYLAWISQGKELQKMLNAPQLRFWHQRNLLDVEKLFKHLYTADALLHDLGAIRRHSLSVFAGALDGIRNLKPHLAFLRSINFKIGHHYHTRAPLPAYPALLRDCQAMTQGFSTGEEERVFPDVEKALKLFIEQLPFTLDKLRRVEDELAREARQVLVKG